MCRVLVFSLALAVASPVTRSRAQATVESGSTPSQAAEDAPLPDPTSLLQDVDRNQRRLESLKRDYTYHVHTDSQELDKHGVVKKTETTDAESLTIEGVRVNRVVARDGKPLTPEQQQKESERLDKDVAKAKERRLRAQSKGADTDERGDPELSLSRILELGSFSNARRVTLEGRPTILLNYNGNPNAKTHSAFETAFRDLTGTVWIDESDRVLVQGQGHLTNDFKLGAGLLADIRKGSNFGFRAHRVADGVWLPATIDVDGSVRIFLVANFNGRTHLTASDYRRFRTSATILPGNRLIGPNGAPEPEAPAGQTSTPSPAATKPEP